MHTTKKNNQSFIVACLYVVNKDVIAWRLGKTPFKKCLMFEFRKSYMTCLFYRIRTGRGLDVASAGKTGMSAVLGQREDGPHGRHHIQL